MKCPECGRNWKRSGGMTCQCRYPFAFDPKSDGLTDGRFMAATAAASGQGARWFTPNQLYSALWLRRATRLRWIYAIGAGLAGLVIGGFLGGAWWLLGVPAAVLGFQLGRSRKSGPTLPEFAAQMARWQQHGRDLNMARLLQEPSLHEPPPQWAEPDIYDYGVERIIIVQHDLLVDWLVKNDLHTEQRALILSESGYPEYLLSAARRQLEERPDTPVFLLHDPGYAASVMLENLRLKLPALEQAQSTDLGLFESHLRRFPTLRHARSPAVDMLPWGVLHGALVAALLARSALADTLAGDSELWADFG